MVWIIGIGGIVVGFIGGVLLTAWLYMKTDTTTKWEDAFPNADPLQCVEDLFH